MSGNPFRRNAPGNVKLQAEETNVQRTPSPFKIGKKEKRVKIQTPPQSPEEIPRRLSAGRVSPPPPEKDSSSDDDSDTTATADSDIEQAMRNTRRNSGSLPPPGVVQAPSAGQSPATTPGAGGAPYNPFARTLATSEAAFGLQRSKDGQDESTQSKPEGSGRGKGMNVDMFKNILMTGSPAPTPPQQHTQHLPPDSSSNTDTSSVSKQSLFDQNYNLHPESPRSSFDHVDYSDEDEADDEKGGLMGTNKERLDDYGPPAPPKPGLPAKRAKGPQTVSFSEFDDINPAEERSSSPANAAVPPGKHRPHMLQRTSSDLNKPLPKTPPRSPGLPQEVPLSMDAQVSQAPQPATPVVTTPDETTKKAAPPPPPTSRRAGQGGTSHTRARSTSDTTQGTAPEPTSPPPQPQDAATKPAAPPPPPPPSRKSKPPSHVAGTTPAGETPPVPDTDNKTMQPPPAPAPRRNPSTKTGGGPSLQRSPSSASHSSAHSHSHTSPAAAPPAPPPRRAVGSKRESLDGAAVRRSSQNSLESARSVSGSGLKPSLPPEAEATKPMESDILADMTAFQAEIDALRKAADGKGGG